MFNQIVRAIKETRAEFTAKLLTIAGKRMQNSTEPSIRAIGKLYASPAYHEKIREYALSGYMLPVTPKRIAHNVRLSVDAYKTGTKMAEQQIQAEYASVLHSFVFAPNGTSHWVDKEGNKVPLKKI